MTASYEHLVVDTNALISGTSLFGHSERYYTIAEVLAEIRDEKARQLLQNLPYKLEVLTPSDEAIAFVTEFAKKTGDIRSLSKADIKLVALCYQLEVQTNGRSNIRDSPPDIQTALDKPEGFHSGPKKINAPCRFYNTEGGCRNGDACRFLHEGPPGPRVGSETREEGEATLEGTTAEDSDEGEWFGPSDQPDCLHINEETGEGAENAAQDENSKPKVAIITTDFPMQNVSLQIGLNLSNLTGQRVRSVKHWVLKCDACELIYPIDPNHPEYNMFCKSCGNSSVNRLGVTIGADGSPRYHYKKDRVISTRGNVYALPKPRTGRSEGLNDKHDLLLRADQLLTGRWKEKLRKAANMERETLLDQRTIDDVLGRGDDAVQSGKPQSLGNYSTGGKVFNSWLSSPYVTADQMLQPGWGRKNPNSVGTHKKSHKKK